MELNEFMKGWNAGKRIVRLFPPPDFPEGGEEIATLLEGDDGEPFESETLTGEVHDEYREDDFDDGLREFTVDQIKGWED